MGHLSRGVSLPAQTMHHPPILLNQLLHRETHTIMYLSKMSIEAHEAEESRRIVPLHPRGLTKNNRNLKTVSPATLP